jgi:hypothetical protein
MCECACPGCQSAEKSSCSGCGREQYCGSVCQKLDWKAHKSICPILQKLPNKQQSFLKVVTVISEILDSKKGKDIRVLQHLLSFAEYQFGKEVQGKLIVKGITANA